MHVLATGMGGQQTLIGCRSGGEARRALARQAGVYPEQIVILQEGQPIRDDAVPAESISFVVLPPAAWRATLDRWRRTGAEFLAESVELLSRRWGSEAGFEELVRALDDASDVVRSSEGWEDAIRELEAMLTGYSTEPGATPESTRRRLVDDLTG